MSEETNNENSVTIRRNELEALLGAFKQIRFGFLQCAPRYAAGSKGEALVAMAMQCGEIVQSVERQMSSSETEEATDGSEGES